VTAEKSCMLLRDTVGSTLQPVTLNVAPAVWLVAWPSEGNRLAVFVICGSKAARYKHCQRLSAAVSMHQLYQHNSLMCVVMWGGRSFGLHTSKVRAKDRGHTYSLHRTHMGCLTWTVRAHVL
jgi:hypothetical protein